MLGVDEQVQTGFDLCEMKGSNENKGCLWVWDGSVDMELDLQVGCYLGSLDIPAYGNAEIDEIDVEIRCFVMLTREGINQ